MKYTPLRCFILFCLSVFSITVHSQSIYNAYAKVTAITSSTLLTVSNVNQANHTFTVGGKVIVMQMQDDVIGTNTVNASTFGNLGAINSAGKFEVAIITAVNLSAGTPTSIGLSTALVNTYNINANSSVQVITFRNLSAAAFTTTNSITGVAWTGSIGGVVALEVGTVFTLAHSITANAIGFTGGTKNTPNGYTACDNSTYATAIATRYAGKGEGIYKNTNVAYAGARGKILNGGGGGNDVNAGGGGGGNYTTGGDGGIGWVAAGTGCSPSAGGLGGLSFSTAIGASRVFMGGGGGAGHENDGVGTAGGAGGGIILIKTGTIVTVACAGISISANGATPANNANDGAGGGGAAGSLIFQVNAWNVAAGCPLTITANGGSGGNSNFGGAGVHGGGGGGAQGPIIFSGATPTLNVSVSAISGSGGTSCSGCAAASGGQSGTGPNNGGIISNSSGVLPIGLMYFTVESRENDVAVKWATATEKNTDYFIVERSLDANTWVPVSRQKAAENSTSSLYYEISDMQPPATVLYYRLRTVDLDKSEETFIIQVADRTNKQKYLIVYPNPAIDNINIATSGNINLVKYRLYDVSGKEVELSVKEILFNRITLDVSGIAKGMYFLQVSENNNSVLNKIILK